MLDSKPECCWVTVIGTDDITTRELVEQAAAWESLMVFEDSGLETVTPEVTCVAETDALEEPEAASRSPCAIEWPTVMKILKAKIHRMNPWWQQVSRVMSGGRRVVEVWRSSFHGSRRSGSMTFVWQTDRHGCGMMGSWTSTGCVWLWSTSSSSIAPCAIAHSPYQQQIQGTMNIKEKGMRSDQISENAFGCRRIQVCAICDLASDVEKQWLHTVQ